MSDVMTPKKTFISVTLDFLATVPGFNVRTRNGLRAALFAIGFDLKNIDVLRGKNIRCKNKPTHYRKADVFAGVMRKDFRYPQIYNRVEVLDVDTVPENVLLVQDLPYDIPVEDRVNVRKYTKQADKVEDIHIANDEPFNFEDLNRLEKLFGIE
ncbi:hypothetical protein BAU67_001794 [Escherichia coli]|nr:hypothetical protein [Escherichia coli]EMB7054238.1 hypothetical protein [Escherichia coli]